MRASARLRDVLREYLVRLRAEDDVNAWLTKPLTPEKSSLADIADWGPAEDWSEWAETATGC